MPDLIDEFRRTEQVDPLVTPQADPHQMVEADEVVHMGMGDEDMAQPQEFPRAQMGDLPQVEEDRPLLEEEIDKDSRIAEWAIDEARMKEWAHKLTVWNGEARIRLRFLRVLRTTVSGPSIPAIFKPSRGSSRLLITVYLTGRHDK